MTKPKYNWMWKRLADRAASPDEGPRPVNYRRPDFMVNADGLTVRYHAPRPVAPALKRFMARTERVRIGSDYCLVWRGGDTFRVDDDTVTTPARFYWEAMKGEKLGENEVLRRACKTPRCVKHKKRQAL